MTIELDPCPFCGSAANLENIAQPQHERRITAGCSNEDCFAYLPHVFFPREADAIAAWNRRPPASLPVQGVRVTEDASDRLGRWLSAALDDPGVCAEMKDDINAWFAAGQPVPTRILGALEQ